VDGIFLSGFVSGAIVGAAGALLYVAYLKWRGAVADVPKARGAALYRFREFAILAGIVALAVAAALNQS
jgi:hypothetical protein